MLLCPRCETLLDVSMLTAGTRFECPFCERVMVVPQPRRRRPEPVAAAAPAPEEALGESSLLMRMSSLELEVMNLPIQSPPSPSNRPEWIDWKARRDGNGRARPWDGHPKPENP